MREIAASTKRGSTRSATSSVSTTARSGRAKRPRLLTGSHYDTVRNGGKYDGRLGIFVPMICVRELHRAGKRLPFGFEVVGFAEEEGQRYKATFLGSGALTGHFDRAWLDQADADGVSDARRDAEHAGLPATLAAIGAFASATRRSYLGFVEVHIEQGPVLNALDLPLGVVTSINGSVRYLGEVDRHGEPRRHHADGHARRDAATAVAELALFLEQPRRRAAEPGRHDGHPDGAQRLDQRRARPLPVHARHPRHDRTKCAMPAPNDVLAELQALICERRGLSHTIEETMRVGRARAIRRGSSAGNVRSRPRACRSSACPAAPATTR